MHNTNLLQHNTCSELMLKLSSTTTLFTTLVKITNLSLLHSIQSLLLFQMTWRITFSQWYLKMLAKLCNCLQKCHLSLPLPRLTWTFPTVWLTELVVFCRKYSALLWQSDSIWYHLDQIWWNDSRFTNSCTECISVQTWCWCLMDTYSTTMPTVPSRQKSLFTGYAKAVSCTSVCC